MFEKCGLRDIFCGFKKSKWLILCAVVIFACIGGVLYHGDQKAYEAKNAKAAADHEVYAGYAYYYLAREDGEILSSAEQKRYAKSYIDLMTAIPSREAILKELQKKHEKAELAQLLDPAVYTDGVTRNKLWENSYYVEKWSSENIIRVKTVAVSKDMCKELMKACQARLESIADSAKDTSLAFEGVYYKKVNSSDVIMSDTAEKAETAEPSAKKILIWLVIGLFAGILISVIRSILFPVLNRASDFELYGIKPIGEVDKKTAALLARVLKQQAGEEVKTITFATGMKNGKKAEELCAALGEELKKLGREVCTGNEEAPDGKLVLSVAVSPDKNADASDLCEKADMVILAEQKGVSLHRRFDETEHYLKLLNIEPAGAVLIA